MTKLHKLPLIGYIFGVSLIISGVIRYHFIFDDWFKFLFTLAIGGLVLSFSYLYQWMKGKDIEDKKQTARIDAIVSWWMNMEKEDVINRARGLEK